MQKRQMNIDLGNHSGRISPRRDCKVKKKKDREGDDEDLQIYMYCKATFYAQVLFMQIM